MCLLLLPFVSWAQVGVSPYSSQGLGNLVTPGFTHNMGMGGVGIATGNGLRINNLNPALLYRNTLTNFDVAFSVEVNDLKSSDATIRQTNGGLAYAAFVFPAIINRLSISVGLNPYSKVGYAGQDTTTIAGSDKIASVALQGDGGLSQVFVAGGARVYKNLSVGLKLSYIFGAIDRTMSIAPLVANSFATSYKESVYHAGIVPEAGVYYAINIGKNSLISVGAIYQPQTQLKSSQNVTLASLVQLAQDTVASSVGSTVLPQKFGLGIGIEKPLAYMVGLDVSVQNWANFATSYENDLQLPANKSNMLQNSMSISLGGELIPDASSVNSYLKRVAYRLGLKYQRTPYLAMIDPSQTSNTQIKDIGVSVGFSLPLNNLSSLNLALEAGKRGNTDNGMIRQNYYKLTLGVSFSDRWFVRRQYE